MSSTSRTQVVEYTYNDPRTGERIRERRIQEVPYEEIEEIRGQELARFRPPQTRAQRDERDYYSPRAYDDNYAVVPRPRDSLAPPNDYRYDDRYAQRRSDRRRYDDRDRRRRRHDDDSSDSSSESSRERRHRRRHRRAKSEQPPVREQDNANDNDDDRSRLWYSGRPRREGKWHERNLDSSYDGLLAAAAGAAIGGITARTWCGDENKRWKIVGGAVAGATAFNLAENKYRIYTEERAEKKQREGRPETEEEGMLAGPVELGGHWISGI